MWHDAYGAAAGRLPCPQGDCMALMTTRRIAGGLGLTLAVVLAFGCARARVKNVEEARSRPLPRPPRVVVFDFYTGAADVGVDTSVGRRATRAVRLSVNPPDLLAQAVADSLASRMVADINALGLSAVRATGAAPPGVNDLVVEGQFVRIDEGSQTRRFVIGFGVGATELRTQVQLFQVTARGWEPIQQFETVATGARFPGAGFFVAGGAVAGTVATSAMISSGVGVVREVRASIDADARRTSEQITRNLSELYAAQRW
jgi:hypothetical protein